MSNLADILAEPRGPWGKEPHRVGERGMMPKFLVAQCGMPMTEVPPAFWSVDGTTATVPCPCGESVVLPVERLIFHTGCERAYVYDGEQVYCINSPKGRPEAVPAEPGVDVPVEPDVA